MVGRVRKLHFARYGAATLARFPCVTTDISNRDAGGNVKLTAELSFGVVGTEQVAAIPHQK